VEGPAVSLCPSDLRAPNKSHDPLLVIPSEAEGSGVRPGSHTKVSVPLVLPQTRHPERSASQIHRVMQRLWRGVEGPRRCRPCPCCSELFNHRSPTTGSVWSQVQLFMQRVKRACTTENLDAGAGDGKDRGGLPGAGSVVEKLRTAWQGRHRRGPSTPRHKRCIAR
jgi:hypothetical protein